jgi:arylsulfatase A-like enzyme
MEPATLPVALGAAAGPAIILAFAFGLRDALRVLRTNAFASLHRYFWAYVATPIVALTALVLPPACGLGVMGFAIGIDARGIAAASAALLAALLVTVEAVGFLRGIQDATKRAQVDRRMRSLAAAVVSVALLGAVIAAAALSALAIRHLGSITMVSAGVAILDIALLAALVVSAAGELRHMLAARIATRAPAAPPGGARDTRPSFVLISVDTLRADRLRSYDGPHGLMPHVDELADMGVVCETAIAQSSWTLPSIASLLTGLNPSRHGAGRALKGFDLLARAPLSSRTWTLPQALRSAGYETHAIVANPYLALQYGLSAGFDTYENVSIESEFVVCLRSTLAGRLLAPALRDRIGGGGTIVTQRALALLRRLGGGAAAQRPFFLWLHYIDPHAPYGCGGNKSFRGDTLLSDVEADGEQSHAHFDAIARLRAGEIRLTPVEKARLVALYDASVADVDRQIGAVLERVPPGPGTLVAVVSDHGEEFWEHGGVEHGHTFYEELVRVPLVLSGAGLPAHHRMRELVRLIDLPPTILSLLGVAPPDGLDGVSFAAAASGRPHLERDERVGLCEGLLFAEGKVAVRTAQYKYVRWENGKEELYDLRTDPAELRDIAANSDLTWARELTSADEAPVPEIVDDLEEHGAVRAALHGLGYV